MTKLVLIFLALLFVGSIADVPAMFLAVQGEISLPFVFIAGFLADVLPDFLWYFLGHKIGIERFSKLRFFRQNPKRVRLMDKAFSKYGGTILFGSKFVYALGIPTQVIAGAHGYPIKKMFLANSAGALAWLLLLYYLAKVFTSVNVVEHYIRDAKFAFLAFAAIALLIHFFLGSPMKRLLNSREN